MNTFPPWVAVLDDEEPIRRALVRLFRSSDVEARAFDSGVEFLNFLHISKPYCLVLDLHMPGMSGFEVQEWLALEAPDIPVIVVTGHHSTEVHLRAMRFKPLMYLFKPMSDQLLLDAIAMAARTNAAHTQAEYD